MKRKVRGKVLRTEWLAVSKLVVVPYYKELYPMPRDWSRLRQSFERHGYKPEHPIVVRPLIGKFDTFETVCGIGRYTVAKERAMRRVPAIIREFTEAEARAYTIESNFETQAASAPISLVHTIALARVLATLVGEHPFQRPWEFTGASESTYWRAVSSLDYVLEAVKKRYPLIAQMEPCHQVDEIIQRDLIPDFTKLFMGKIEVHTFYKGHCQKHPVKQSKRAALKKRASNHRKDVGGNRRKDQAVSVESSVPSSNYLPLPLASATQSTSPLTEITEKRSRQGARKSIAQPLFDLLRDEP